MIIRQATLDDAQAIAKGRFYEALGGQLVKTSQFELSGATIDEVAYGWPNIRMLLRE